MANIVHVCMKLAVRTPSKTYEFEIVLEKDDDHGVHYFIGRPTLRTGACVWIEVHEGPGKIMEATLHGIGYHKSCSTTRDLEEGRGTIAMLQGALRYVLEKHPKVDRVALTDNAYKYVKSLNTRVLITPRRLFQGKQGWYQEHFGASPADRNTVQLLRLLQKNKDNLHVIAPEANNDGWGTYQDIQAAMDRLTSSQGARIFHTSWYIPRKAIMEYAVGRECHQSVSTCASGGSTIKSTQGFTNKVKRKVMRNVGWNPHGRCEAEFFMYE
jgi:hypothetical protein